MFVSHDYHRPIGVSRPMALQLHARKALLRGEFCLALTEKEQDLACQIAKIFLAEKLSSVEPEDRDALLAPLTVHLSENHYVLRRECVSVVDPGIAKRKFPKLFPSDESDKRSLVSLDELEEIGPGVFKIGELVVFAHRYFRRSLSQINNTNDAFLSRFFALRGRMGLTLKIALDPDSIGLASSYLTPIELEYWRGPKFDDDLTAIPAGVTEHSASEKDRAFQGISRTEFFWHLQNGMRSFECEELLDSETLGIGGDSFGCRYAHSIIDSSTHLPNHLDGAIRVYDSSHYLERIETDISKAGKKSHYVKLWRIDGPIDLACWKGLICDFFRGNSLPGEYLGGDPATPASDRNDDEMMISDNSLISPISLDAGDLQIAVSYHSPEDLSEPPAEAYVLGARFIDNGTPIGTIELSALDLIKLTQRSLNKPIHVSPEMVYWAMDDMDINHPTIFFGGERAIHDANTWKSALATLCQAFASSDEDRFITAAVGIDYGEVVIKFAFAGLALQLAKAVSDVADFPDSIEGVSQWCVSSYAYLKQSIAYPEGLSFTPSLFKIDGSLTMDRAYIHPKHLHVDDNSIVSLRLPPEQRELAEALDQGRLSVVQSVHVKSCTCSRCGDSYFTCLCSVFVDKEFTVSCDRVQSCRLFITERPAHKQNHEGRAP